MSHRIGHLLPLVTLLALAGGTWALLRMLPRESEGPEDGPVGVVRSSRLDDGRTQVVDRRLGVMGTEVTITALGEDEETLRAATAAAFARIETMESRLSRWRPDSDVSRVNAAAGETVPVHAETAGVVSRALAVSRATRGAFDPTAGPLLLLWKDRVDEPAEDEILAARARVGADRVRVVTGPAPSVTLEAGTGLDLGGIAKGTIVDAAGAVLRERGVTAFLVNAGGDMLAHGAGPDGDGILVDLRDPRAGPGETMSGQRLRLRDRAVCTSGSYARGARVAGRRVSHIVDPRTGRPVTDSVLQATVVATRCETADALATALMVLGREGLSFAAAMEGVEALLVLSENDARVLAATPGFGALRAEAGR